LALRGPWVIGETDEVVHGALEWPAELIDRIRFDMDALAMFQLRDPTLRDVELGRQRLLAELEVLSSLA
jgi:hypothetical protein